MRLTNYIRNAFIRSVMNDVPQVDYADQARKIVHKSLDDMFAHATGGLSRKLMVETGWLSKCAVEVPGNLANVYTAAPDYTVLRHKAPEVWKELSLLAEQSRKQSQSLKSLEDSIHAVAYSVTTRKALADALPEFVKYLPEDEAKAIRTLPVVQNVVANFVKAGWPAKRGAVAA